MKEQSEPTPIIEVSSDINIILDTVNGIVDVETRNNILSQLKTNDELGTDIILGVESLDPIEFIIFIVLCEKSKQMVIDTNLQFFKFEEGGNIICFVSNNKEAILGTLKKLFTFEEENTQRHKEINNLFEENGGEEIR